MSHVAHEILHSEQGLFVMPYSRCVCVCENVVHYFKQKGSGCWGKGDGRRQESIGLALEFSIFYLSERKGRWRKSPHVQLKKREKKEKEREFQTSAALHTARSIWYRLMAAGLLISLCAAPLRPLFLNFLITAFFVCSKVPSSRQGVAELIFAAFSIKHIGKIHHVTALACSRVRCGCLIVFYCAPSKP